MRGAKLCGFRSPPKAAHRSTLREWPAAIGDSIMAIYAKVRIQNLVNLSLNLSRA
jgi:hypothetical protein